MRSTLTKLVTRGILTEAAAGLVTLMGKPIAQAAASWTAAAAAVSSVRGEAADRLQPP
jgi:hypothetical protein